MARCLHKMQLRHQQEKGKENILRFLNKKNLKHLVISRLVCNFAELFEVKCIY